MLRAEEGKLSAKLKQSRASIRTAVARMLAVDTAIAQLSAIQPKDIRSIRQTPRMEGRKHGDFRRELVRVLKEADGPVWGKELIRHMAYTFNLPMDTFEQRTRASYLVRRPLNVFKEKGAVERLPTGGNNTEGLWRWRHNYEDGDA